MNLWRDQRGVVGIQVILMIVVLLGFGAFAIDYGVLLVARTQAQDAADAGALAAATALAFDNMTDSDLATKHARAAATGTMVWGAPPTIDEPTYCFDPFDPTCPMIPGVPTPEERSSFSVTVRVYRDGGKSAPAPTDDPESGPPDNGSDALPTFLARLFGVTSQGVRAQATATVAPVNVATCVWPLAIPDDWRSIHPPDDTLPLAAICTDASDLRCKPFTKYDYSIPGTATVAKPDVYVAPSMVSELSSTSTGYELTELDVVMKPNGQVDPQILVDLLGPDPADPTVWRPARRSSFAALQIDGGFGAHLTSCGPTRLYFGASVPLDAAAASDPAGAWAQAAAGAIELVSGGDAAASWVGGMDAKGKPSGPYRIRGSCAGAGSCGPISPRLVLVPVFDPEEYDRTRRVSGPNCDGVPCIKIVNFIGFFLDSATDSSKIVGHLTTYPGRIVDTSDPVNRPFVGYKWAFMRTAVLTR